MAALAACAAPTPAKSTAELGLARANPKDVAMVYFGSYDANQDGVATVDEFIKAALIPAGYDVLPAPTPIVSSDANTSSATMVKPSEEALRASFAALDTNKDGKLTQAELLVDLQAKEPSPGPSP